MDAHQFDALSKALAGGVSRRQAVRRLGGGGLVGGLLATIGLRPARAQDDGGDRCVLDFRATVRLGPSRDAGREELRGELRLPIGERGGIDSGVLTLADGSQAPVVGHTSGRAVSLRIQLPDGRRIVAVGAGDWGLRTCDGEYGGPATGPETGDLGDWIGTPLDNAAIEENPCGILCPPDQTLDFERCECVCPPGTQPCGGACVALCGPGTALDPNSCECGVACPDGQSLCGEACVDLSADAANCGECGNACGGETPCCTNGVCGGECGTDGCCADCFASEIPGSGIDEFSAACCDPSLVCRSPSGPEFDGCCYADDVCLGDGSCCCDGCVGTIVCGGVCCAAASCCGGTCCGEGQVCRCGACRPANPTCATDDECCEGERCVAGVCCSGDRACVDESNNVVCCQAGEYCDSMGGYSTCCPVGVVCTTFRPRKARF